jgi:lipoprotein signal peptidase
MVSIILNLFQNLINKMLSQNNTDIVQKFNELKLFTMTYGKGMAFSLILGLSDLRGKFCLRQNLKPLKCYALPVSF